MSTNSFKIKNSAVLTPKDLSTLVSPEAGEIACDINDSNKIKRYDAASASWVEVGSGGVGSVDIMFVQDFESASLSSFTQTGLSLSTTNPLHGKVSAVLTHQAAVNQSFKEIKIVDPKFRGQAIVLDLNVKSAASAGNVVIKVRDESNSADLIVSEALQLSNDVSGRRSSVSFTIPSTCSSLSYTITALPEAGSPVTRIDDIVAMLSDVSLLETSVLVPNLTAWQGYTPTFQGFGTPSNVEFEWRQVGENVEIRSKFRTGTTTAVEARIGLPAGLTSAGTSLIPSIQMVGSLQVSSIGGVGQAIGSSYSVLIEPSVSYVTLSTRASSNAGLTKVNANTIGSSEDVSFFASIPCAGLSATTTKTIPLTQSGLVQEGDSYLRIVGFTPAVGSTNNRIITIISGTTQNSIGSDIIYADSAANGASFTAATSGVYSFSFSAELGTSSNGIGFSLNSNQLTTRYSLINNANKLGTGYDSGGNMVSTVSTTVYLNVGDVVRLHADSPTFTSSDGTYSTLIVTKQGSLKQVSVSSDQKITIPTSELRFEGASARGTGTETAIVQFTSMAKLRGDAFTVDNSNGTAITMRKAGKLDVSASLRNTNGTCRISKNQSIRTALPTASESLASESGNGLDATFAWSGFVSIGDVIRICADNTPTSATGNQLNLSFQEQDIAVSVTNTLPQFSQSDSSVRLDTANGYGSVTNNRIRRFSNVRDNVGSDIEYLDSATNGASFTAKSAGIYNISYTEQASSAAFFGLSKNSSQLTTSIISITTADRLAIGTTDSISGYPETIAWQGYLQAGDVVRAHTEGALGSAGPERTQFTISKVGKPNVTGVDVTPFVNVPQPIQGIYHATINGSYNIVSVLKENRNGLFIVDDTVASNRIRFTALKRIKIDGNAFIGCQNGTYEEAGVTWYNSNGLVISAAAYRSDYLTTGVSATASSSYLLEVGEYVEVSFYSLLFDSGCFTIVATALSDQILTAPESFSTDTASLSYASSSLYNLTTLANAPVGTYITFTYAANTNTRTQTSTRPNQTDADMNANGLLLFPRAYNAPSVAANPAAFAIQIGKGLKGRSLDLYKSAGKVTSGNLDYAFSGIQALGASVKDYNEVTGVLIVDAAFVDAAGTTHNFVFSDVTTQASGYLVINASKNPALTGLGLGTVAARAVNTAGTSIPAITTTTVTFDSTKSFDTHNALNTTTGVFTAPESGYYTFSASAATPSATVWAVDDAFNVYVNKNGSQVAANSIQITVARTISMSASVSDSIYLAKNDTLTMSILHDRGAGALTLATFSGAVYFSIAKTSVGTGN